MRTRARVHFRFSYPIIVVEFNGTLNAHTVVRQDFRYFLLRPIFSFSNTDRWTGRPVTIRSAESLYTSIYVNMYRRSIRNVFFF